MKTTIFLVLYLLLFESLNAQIYWISNLNSAKKIGKEEGKLLLIDFWAYWCEPCNKMNAELWNREESVKFAKNFVAAKIDIDADKSTAIYYSAKAIPMVVIALADGTKLWGKVGYSSPDEYIKVLSAIPSDVSQLYARLDLLEGNEKEPNSNQNVAIEYQKLGKKTENRTLKNIFLLEGTKYFKKAIKFSADSKQKEAADLYLIINDIYYGSPDKALKNFSKDFKSADNCQNKDLAHFLLASYYKSMKDDNNFKQESSLIADKELLNQLE